MNEKMVQCTAKSKQTGKRCGNAPTAGRNVCRFHGGKTPRGLKLPQTKTGRWSKVLTARLLAQFEESLRDPELLQLNRDLALIDARIAEQMQRVEQGESGYVWDQLAKARAGVLTARARKDKAGQTAALAEIFRLIECGAQDVGAWRDIHGLLEQRRRFVESETNRQLKLAQGVTLEQVGLYFNLLTQAVKEEVDRETLARIQNKFEQLSTANKPGGYIN